MHRIIAIFTTLFFLACSGKKNDQQALNESSHTDATAEEKKAPQSTPSTPSQADSEKPDITIRTFKVGDKGWGYDILLNGNKYVHQDHIPAIQGKHEFQSEEQAKKAAALVKHKIRQNIMPPLVTPQELDSLGIEY